MTYTFRNRFKYDGVRLAADVQEYVLAEPPSEDGRIVLQAAPPAETIGQANELILQGSGYSDFDSAAAAGRRWRQYMTVAMARDRKAADFGDDDESRLIPLQDRALEQDPSGIFSRLGVNLGDRIVEDRHGLLVFPTLPAFRCMHIQGGQAIVSVGIGGFVNGPLQAARAASYTPFDARQNLAYVLVHNALSDRNPETRYIQLVTAIEALLPERQRPEAILRALSELAGVVEGWPDGETKTRISQILDKNREESVRRIAIDLVSQLEGTYDDMTPKRFFDLCYGKRSAIVHGNAERPDATESHTLLLFVLDVLDLYANNTRSDPPGGQCSSSPDRLAENSAACPAAGRA